MPSLHAFPMLFLAQARIEAMNQAIRSRDTVDHSSSYIMLAVIALSILISIGVVYLVKRQSRRFANDSRKLFVELCRAHHLSWPHRRLLAEMARVKKVKDPAWLLIDAELWSFDTMEEAKFCAPKMQGRVQLLRRLLFSPSGSAVR